LFITTCIEKQCTRPLSTKKKDKNTDEKIFASLEFDFFRV